MIALLSVSVSAQIIRLRPIAPTLVTIVKSSSASLSWWTLELALAGLKAKAQWSVLVIMTHAIIWKAWSTA